MEGARSQIRNSYNYCLGCQNGNFDDCFVIKYHDITNSFIKIKFNIKIINYSLMYSTCINNKTYGILILINNNFLIKNNRKI